VTGDEHDYSHQRHPKAYIQAAVTFQVSVLSSQCSRSCAAWSRRENELQVPDSHCTALDNVQARFAEQGDYFGQLDVTVAVQAREKASLFSCGASEVNGKHSSARLQNPSDLAGALFSSFAGQMMKHQRAQDNVEMCVRKWQRFDNPIFEDNLDLRLSRLLTCPGNHLRRRVDPIYRACWPDMRFGGDRKGPCSTAHIQNGFARLKARQAENLLTKSTFPSQRHQPDQEIIASSRVQDAGRAWR
jgi:hypothetical protein